MTGCKDEGSKLAGVLALSTCFISPISSKIDFLPPSPPLTNNLITNMRANFSPFFHYHIVMVSKRGTAGARISATLLRSPRERCFFAGYSVFYLPLINTFSFNSSCQTPIHRAIMLGYVHCRAINRALSNPTGANPSFNISDILSELYC